MAVESLTRTSTSSGITVPNSARTALGSITARARYGLSLYQSGGNPNISRG